MKKRTTEEWDFIMTDSEYNIARTLLETYREGDNEQLGLALERFLESSKRNALHELWQELRNLIELILLWKLSNTYQTDENREKIVHHQSEIDYIKEFNPFITEKMIADTFTEALKNAQDLITSYLPSIQEYPYLTQEEVFNFDFKTAEYGKKQ